MTFEDIQGTDDCYGGYEDIDPSRPEDLYHPTFADETGDTLPDSDILPTEISPTIAEQDRLRDLEALADAEVVVAYASMPRLKASSEFIGAYETDPEMHDFPEYFMEVVRSGHAAAYEGQQELSDHQKDTIRIADEGIARICEIANVEIGPAFGPVRIFGERQYYDLAYREHHTDEPNIGGGVLATMGGVLWHQREDPAWDRIGLVHERVHQHEYRRFNTEAVPRGDGTINVDVTMRSGNDSPLNESVADMAENRILRLTGDTSGYTHVMNDILLDGMITHTASELGVKEEFVEFALYRDKFGGASEGVDLFRQVFDATALQKVLDIERSLTLRGALPIAEALNTPKTADFIKKLIPDDDAGKPWVLSLFRWMKDAPKK
jgi:hypothetical protein